MIEIKRKCSSSVRNDPVEKKITFGDFTIRITEEDWDHFDSVLQDCKLSPVEALEQVLYAALDPYWYSRLTYKPEGDNVDDY